MSNCNENNCPGWVGAMLVGAVIVLAVLADFLNNYV